MPWRFSKTALCFNHYREECKLHIYIFFYIGTFCSSPPYLSERKGKMECVLFQLRDSGCSEWNAGVLHILHHKPHTIYPILHTILCYLNHLDWSCHNLTLEFYIYLALQLGRSAFTLGVADGERSTHSIQYHR